MALRTDPPHLHNLHLGTDLYEVYNTKMTQCVKTLKTNVAI